MDWWLMVLASLAGTGFPFIMSVVYLRIWGRDLRSGEAKKRVAAAVQVGVAVGWPVALAAVALHYGGLL